MSNVLPMETRVRIASALTEGNSIRATSRMVGADKNTIMDFALRLGEGCAHLHNKHVRGLASFLVEGDETWSFIAKKEARCDPSKDPAEWGDVYSFIALDSVSKVVISFLVGKRDGASTDAFIADLRARLTVVPQFTTDGWQPYISAVGASFGGSIDYAQVVKNYRHGASRGPDHRYEPPRDPFITKIPIFGAPDFDRMSTSHVERVNLTMRHTVGRTRRLCLAFSKTMRGHSAAMALGVMAYNFCRLHLAIGGDRTPAMAARVADHPWTMAELVTAALAEETSAAPVAVPLKLPVERAGRAIGTARELPNGRGFLRVVGGGSSPAAPPPTSGPAPSAPAAPVVHVTVPVASGPAGQLDLLSWVAPPVKPRPAVQLSLFGIEIEGEEGPK